MKSIRSENRILKKCNLSTRGPLVQEGGGVAAASTVPGWRRCGRGVFWSRRAAVWPRRLLVHGGGGVAAPSSGTWGRRCSHAVLGYMGRRCGPWFTNHPSFVNHVCKSRAMVYKPRAPSPETCPWLTPTQDVKMSRCPDLSVAILSTVGCQDVKIGVWTSYRP